VIADALNAYKGAMIIVSHDEEFVRKLDGLQSIDLGRLV
jgi:ATPase subunit of ABC transporter with duplicated ATPase domains